MNKHFFQIQMFILSIFLFACSNPPAPKSPKVAKENKTSKEKNTSKKNVSETKKEEKAKSLPKEEEIYEDLSTPPEPFISSGDTIRIEVLDEENLTREVVVPANGRVFYPLLKQIEVKGRTTKELSEELTQKLSEFLVSPMVNISISKRAHNKVYIYAGADASRAFVLKQGETMTASRLLISAGIPLDADLNEVYLVRKGRSGKKKTIRLPIKNVLENYELGKDAVLQPEDLLIIKKSGKVYIQGHVVKPGAYPIPKGEKLNLWALIIKANGPLDKADLDHVKIIRQKNNNEREIFLVSASPT